MTDSNNCPSCQCLTDNVAQQLVRSNFCPGHWPCLYICPDGYETGPGGCNTCVCRDGPLMQQGCGAVGCSLYCNVTGYLRTNDGCPTCLCRGQCNAPSCPSSCPVGFINTKDSNGCDVCYCASCPFLGCRLQCPNNRYEYDSATGCRLCQCSQSGGNCPQLNCDMRCLDGYQVDQSTQCPICLCNPDPTGGRCPRMECLAQCPNGQYAVDANGCQTCTCQSHCPSLMGCNLINCAAGLVNDVNGCPQCQCETSSQNNHLCTISNCDMPCAYVENGLQKDQNNCDICVCADSQCPSLPVVCTWINCPQGLDLLPGNNCPTCACSQRPGQTCVPSQCSLSCPDGFRKDSNNCDLCQCKNPQCAPLDCFYANCPSGLLQDSRGCDTCSCRDSQNQICPPVRCPTSCSFGYARDINQCETCVCQQPPFCQPISADCGFTNCPGGLVTDPKGCQTCQCRSHPDQNCQPQRCPLASQCRYGLIKSPVDNCEICACYELPTGCPELPSSCNILNCPGGYVTDFRGCPQCDCSMQPGQTCSPVTCPSRCPLGYQQDIRGCLVCVCNKPGQRLDCPQLRPECTCPFNETPILDVHGCNTCNCEIMRCTGIPILLNCRVKTCEQGSDGCWFCTCALPGRPQCSISSCYKFCRTGFVMDSLGCQTCECKDSALEVICPDISGCNLVCANGHRRDSNSCEACECNPVACAPLQCTQTCTFGRKTDSSGCPTCQCNCLPLSCSLQCPLGLRVNSESCPVCECRETSDTRDFSLFSCRQSPEMLNCEGGKYCGENDENCIECSCFSSDRSRGCENMVTQCRLQCSGGYDTDQSDCEICRCRGSTCPVFDCMELCQYGYLVNARGCPSCTCRTTPCPQVMCPTNLRCTAGFELDSHGCPTCSCKPTNEVCKKPICPLACPHGLLTVGSDGCEICECRCPLQCINSCPSGYLNAPNGCPACDSSVGCPYCQCAPSTCPDVSSCSLSCLQGFEVDSVSGCQLCVCRQPSVCSPVSCSPTIFCPNGMETDSRGCTVCSCSRCAPLTSCNILCFDGFKQDGNNCDICECKDVPNQCSPLNCPLSCPSGYRRDGQGCDICACADAPQCPVFICPFSCSSGYVTDLNGCPRCHCRSTSPVICIRRPCELDCHNQGRITDPRGCELCHCHSQVPPTCDPSVLGSCSAWCLNGYQVDAANCPVCMCNPPDPKSNDLQSCPMLDKTTCPMTCPYGYQSSPNGCAVCVCQNQPTNLPFDDCGPLNCPLNCHYGLRIDGRGCPLCVCK